MATEIYVALISTCIAPTILFFLQLFRERKSDIRNTIKEIQLSTLRLELQYAIAHTPMDKKTIYTLYTRYKEKGGNFYMDDIFKSWRAKYDKRGKQWKNS